jgi:hypothetical protein
MTSLTPQTRNPEFRQITSSQPAIYGHAVARASANDRLPQGHWFWAWLMAAVMAVTGVATYEGFWRWRQFIPTVSDDSDLWIMMRDRVRPHDPRQVVLLGDSRSRFSFDLETLGQEFDAPPAIQLSVNDWSCLPVLADLSRDENFRGLVICEVTLRLWFRNEPYSGLQTEYVQRRQEQTILAGVERWLRLQLQSRFVFRHPDLTPTWLLERWSRGLGPPRPGFIIVSPDRSMRADFLAAGPVRLARQLELNRTLAGIRGEGVELAQFPAALGHLEELVAAIRERGGEVVFAQLPTTGIVHQREADLYPRRQYWDQLQAGTRAVAIQCEDLPDFSTFAYPDESHLDYREAPRFTKAFAKVVRTRLNDRSESQFWK